MKNNMKMRLVSLAVSVGMIISLAACGSSEKTAADSSSATTSVVTEKSTSAEKADLKFWTFHTNAEREFMQSIPEKYKAVNPNVNVTYENFPESDYMGTKLTTAFAANAGPDVFVMSSGDFLKYANSGVAMDLTSYYTDEILNDFLPSSIDAVTVDNKIVGIPFEVELLGLYYNKDMLKEANLEVPKTWDELIAATKALKKDDVAPLVIETTKGYYQNFTWYPFLWQTGANVLDASTKTATFEGDGVEKSLQLWGDLINAGAPSKLSIALTNDTSLLGSGKAAMQICGTWAIASLEKEYKDTNIGLAPLPIPEGGKAATCAGGWKMMVNSKSANTDAAAKFAMWAFAEDVELPLEWCTSTKFAYSPRNSVVEAGKDIYSKGLREVFTNEIYSTAIGEPRYQAEIVNAVGDALQSVMFGKGNAKDEAKKANDKISEFLKNYEGNM